MRGVAETISVSGTDVLWEAPQPSRTAHCAANWIKLMLEKNLDEKFDLTTKLEQFSEKKVPPPIQGLNQMHYPPLRPVSRYLASYVL